MCTLFEMKSISFKTENNQQEITSAKKIQSFHPVVMHIYV